MGYRLPGAFLALANRLLPIAAPGRRAVAFGARRRRSARPAPLHADELVAAVAEHAVALAKEFATVAVIASDARVDELRPRSKPAASCSPSRARSSPDRPIVVVPAALAKGLEFDAVIVVEPAEIAGDRTARRAPAVRRADPRGAASRRSPTPSDLPDGLAARSRRTLASMAESDAPSTISTRSGKRPRRRVRPIPSCTVDGGVRSSSARTACSTSGGTPTPTYDRR